MKLRKTVSLLLTVVTLVGMAGCSFISGSKKDSSSEEVIEYTEYKLVDNGNSEYKIVLPDEPTYDEEIAALEVEELFKEATSITLETVSESEVTYSDTAKWIVLGDTKYTQNTGVDVSAIPNDGFTLKTVGANLFVLADDAGVVYGVHEFFEKAFGFEYYVKDVYALNKNVKDSYMPKLNISDSPDIEFRADAWGAEVSEQGSYRSRVRSFNDAFMANGMYHVHNTFEWLPKSTYEGTHSNWYSDDGTQLCYTAHGNATELATMQATVLEKFKEQVNYFFGKGDYRSAISFTQQDSTTGSWCSCSACTKDMQTYGAASSSLIRFLNPVAKQFKTWLAENYPGREVDIVFFAYQRSESAPVKQENGKLVAADQSLVLEDNLAVWVAPIAGDYIRSVKDVRNQNMYNLFKNWAVLAKQFYVWGYDTNFKNYLMWYDTFNALPDFYEYLNDFNVKYMFNQGQLHSESNLTGFDALKIALNYKLMWDTDTDVEGFTDRFFKTWFGDAAQDMRTYYDSFISWSEKIKTEQSYNGNIYFEGYTKLHYPLEELKKWLSNVENAYKSIEGLKASKPNRYNNLYKRINAESLAVRYALITLHSTSYNRNELTSMKQSFKEDASKLGFIRFSEGAEMNELYAAWGI